MFKPCAIFSDHMVLCRNKEIAVFGTAPNGAVITASILGHTAFTTAKDGSFLIHLPPIQACTGAELTVTDGVDKYTYRDVAIGEVYFAGGQSNMELELQNADDGKRILENEHNEQLRFFYVPKQPVWHDEAQKQFDSTTWMRMENCQCAVVSAVGYFFAAKLQRELNVPVGVICCSWGGTSATAWIDHETLVQTDAGRRIWDHYMATDGQKPDAQFDAEMAAYEADYQAWNGRVEALRKKDPDIIWKDINEQAGICPWPQPLGPKSPYRPCGLVETMVKRVAPYTLSGFLYYQGEEDVQRAEDYFPLLTTVIFHWRKLFHDATLPFLNVQLPMFIANGEADDKRWSIIRQAQEDAYQTLKNTGLAITIDHGEFDNIHPTDKKLVGDRLCFEALRVIYGMDAPEFPRAISKQSRDNQLQVNISHAVQADGDALLMEVAGEDGLFYPAKASINGKTIMLCANEVANPIACRYAWINYALVNVKGENGLPLAPFCLN